MGKFFHGWRRKIGGLLLVTACALMAGWLRSLSTNDVAGIPATNNMFLFSTPNVVVLMIEQFVNPVASSPARSVGMAAVGVDVVDHVVLPHLSWQSGVSNPLNEVIIDWSWQSCGFGIGKVSAGGESNLPYASAFTVWTIPYWSLTIPLTLLSADLILWKPRKRGGISK